LNELAKVFNVTVDYILNNEDEIELTLKDTEQAEQDKTDVTEERLDEILEIENSENEVEKDLTKIKTKTDKEKDTNISQNTMAIVALVLAGMSLVCNFIFVPFIGLPLSIVGLSLAKSGKKELVLNEKSLQLYKLARLLNIIFIILAIVWMIILTILTASYGFKIWR